MEGLVVLEVLKVLEVRVVSSFSKEMALMALKSSPELMT